MKKTIFSFIAIATLFSVSTANAQDHTTKNHTTWMKKTTFGVRAGVGLQNITGKDENGRKLDYKLTPAVNAGVNVEIPLVKDFYLQPGVLISTRGAKYSDNKTLNLVYLEVPVNFVYKPALGMGHLIAGFGPYVDFGLGGKIKYGGETPDQDIHFTNNPTNESSFYRRVGAGANLLFGYEFKNKLSFQLNTQLGLTDINPKYDNVVTSKAVSKNVGFGISAGYRF
ncbi:porin family protein [soil metagenome]